MKTKDITNQDQKKSLFRRLLQTDRIQLSSYLQDDKNFKLLLNRNSKRKFAVATFMITASMLPYSDLLLDFFVNTKEIPLNRFPNLSYAIWAYGSPISAMLVLFISKVLNPPKWTYIATIYVNLSQILAYLYLQFDLNIESDWLFRLINLIFSLILFYLIAKAIAIYQSMKLVDDLKEEFLKERNLYEQENL